MLEEPQFNCIYQQGEKVNLLVQSVDENTVLVVVFPAHVAVGDRGAGVVKYYLGSAIERLSSQLHAAKERSPDQGLDLAMLNVASADELFKRKGL